MGFGSSWLRFAFAHLLSLELQVVIWFIPSKLNIALTYVMAHIYTHHHKPRFSVRWICRICCVVVECALGCQEHVNMNMHGHGSCRSVLGIMLTLPMFCFGRCKSIQRWDFNFEIIQPWYWSLVRMSPSRLSGSLSSPVILAQHSCVMSRHVTSWCVSYVLQFFHLHFVTCVINSWSILCTMTRFRNESVQIDYVLLHPDKDCRQWGGRRRFQQPGASKHQGF